MPGVYMNFHSLLCVADFVTILIFTLILETVWEVLGLHMVSDHTPPSVAELPTNITHPLLGSWGLATEAQQF